MLRVVKVGMVLCGVLSGLCLAEIPDWRTGEAIWGTWPIEPGPGLCLAYRNVLPFDLRYADLSGHTMTHANFSNSLLDWTRFTGSDLSFANFTGTGLANVDFTDAVIAHANFSGTNFIGAQLYSTRSYQEKDLRGLVLDNNYLSGGDFSGQNMTGASFLKSSLDNANFRGANLTGATFGDASLAHADLADATINSVRFWNSPNNGDGVLSRDQLVSTRSYQDKNLSGIELPGYFNLSQMDLSGFDLSGMIFFYVNVNQANFTDARINGFTFSGYSGTQSSTSLFRKEQLVTTRSYQQKDLSGVRIGGGDYSGVDFSGFDLTDAGFTQMNLANADFTGAVIAGCDFSGSSNFTGVQFYSTKSYQDRDVHGVYLNSLDLSGADFHDLAMEGASFNQSNLRGVDFTGTDLTGASFINSFFPGALFTNAIIRGADFSAAWGYKVSTQGNPLSAEQLYSTKSYKDKDLTGINFGVSEDQSDFPYRSVSYNLSEQNLTDANFSRASLSCSFERAILKNVNFADASLGQGANFSDTTSRGFTREQFYSTRSYKNKILSSVNLSRNDLSGWQFSGQQVSSVNFSFSNLSGVMFDKAVLRGVNFTGTNLTGVDFKGSTFSDMIFNDAIIRYADFSQTNFNAEQLYTTKSYKDKDLRGIGLKDRVLTGSDFSGQNLTDAVFSGATLLETDFTGAIIQGADFSSTTSRGLTALRFYSTKSYQDKDLRGVKLRNNVMTGADFHEQNLTGADFTGSVLTGVDFTDAMIQYADFSATVGFMGAQLYSTQSYKQKDLRGIGLRQRDIRGAVFAGFDLTGATFGGSYLGDVDFTDACIAWVDFKGATGLTTEQFRSTQSYKERDIEGVGLAGRLLTGFDLSGFNLSSVDFTGATLAEVPMQDARVAGTRFTQTTANGFSKEQLYATKNWQEKDLSGIHLDKNDLTGWDFSGQNLSGATFASSRLTGATFDNAIVRFTDFGASSIGGPQFYATKSYRDRDLRGVGLSNIDLQGGYFYGQTMTDVDFTNSPLGRTEFSLADLRGAKGFNPVATTCRRSTILPDGTVEGLTLYASEILIVRNHPTAVRIRQSMSLSEDSAIQFILSENWASPIILDSDISAVLAGALQLQFDEEASIDALTGTTFLLFDWNGALGEYQRFAAVISLPGVEWDLSRLYTTGEVTLIPEPTSMLLLGFGAILGLRRNRHGGNQE